MTDRELATAAPPQPADPLVDVNRAFATKLATSSCNVEHVVHEHMPHGFYFFPGVLHQGDAAYATVSGFLKRRGLI